MFVGLAIGAAVVSKVVGSVVVVSAVGLAMGLALGNAVGVLLGIVVEGVVGFAVGFVVGNGVGDAVGMQVVSAACLHATRSVLTLPSESVTGPQVWLAVLNVTCRLQREAPEVYPVHRPGQSPFRIAASGLQSVELSHDRPSPMARQVNGSNA